MFGLANRVGTGKDCEPTFSREVNTLEPAVMVLLEILQDQAFQGLRDPNITAEGGKKFCSSLLIWKTDEHKEKISYP